MARKSITTKVVNYSTINSRYVGTRMKVITCTRNTNLNESGIQKKGFFMELCSKLNPNRLTTISGYSMSKMKPGSFCTMNDKGMVVPCVNGQDYVDIDKQDVLFEKTCSKLNFS